MDLRKDLEFIILLEEMKKIFRMTKIIGENRRENDAEHSWHIATMALFLDKYSKNKIDTSKVIKILLVHDLVEIFAGDTFAYDEKKKLDKNDREKNAMDKLISYLDEDKAQLLNSLWREFEDKKTEESIFANAMDRLQPILSNIYAENGGTWKENQVKLSQILDRVNIIKKFNEEIYNYIYNEIMNNVEKGNILKDI